MMYPTQQMIISNAHMRKNTTHNTKRWKHARPKGEVSVTTWRIVQKQASKWKWDLRKE